IYTAFETMNEVAEAMTAALGDPKSTEIIWRAKSDTVIEGDAVGTLMKLLDALDDDDDVQNVWTNADISDAEMAKHGG
ncbi:MAG: YebC/PmpR family DNA-binding transcriptional regulator, partial [Alphaproteobacteria bacterium]